MKEIKRFFAVMLVPLVFHAAWADDAPDTARAAARRSVTNLSVTGRNTNTTRGSASNRNLSQPRERGTTARGASKQDDITRPTQVVNRPGTHTGTISNRPQSQSINRGVTQSRTATTSASRPSVTHGAGTTGATQSRSATRSGAARSAIVSRNATAQSTLLSRNYSQCRSVFNNCMDEFCANKDSLLKRCACSARMNEFTNAQQNLNAIEEKLLDFSQRLITVNMDREDVIALNQATAGELAYAAEDKSKSKQMLDEIAKKLNTSFDDDNFNQGLNAISLSLDTNAAFDNVDSMAGASMTTKSGTQLYTAALPTCRAMAAEVCTPDELAIAESGYQMIIEQDCNTVAKSYQSQTDQARNKLLESSALLDISRLDIHQKRNSDDILTCKKKMLTMLTDSNVCGTDMGKCLDTTGRYIDPTTGTAFLTPDLANLANLISRPESGHTWSNAPGNSKFVTFLNSKKVFLESATENCQDIADYVWDSFIEDALAQIKLAQDKKLEEMRQSCTTLTTQCLDDAFDSISKFDARALSVFGVAADMTVNGMCTDIRNACTALMNDTDDNSAWSTGIEQIATDKTYDTILSTCREIGRACIIDACTSISGNFGLCENIDTSINRKSIINRTACWDEVVDCVASAGSETLAKIMADRNATQKSGDIYETLYGQEITRSEDNSASDTDAILVYDICSKCGNNGELDCNTCRLAEQIWGNCEHYPRKELQEADDTNKILVMNSNDENETLLSWFAHNTGTAYVNDSCRDTTCPFGYRNVGNGTCALSDNFTGDGMYCTTDRIMHIFDDKTLTNCCSSRTDTKTATIMQSNGNCCYTSVVNASEWENMYKTAAATTPASLYVCAPSTNAQNAHIVLTTNEYSLVCVGELSGDNITDEYPSGQTIKCSGEYIKIYNDGIHERPTYQVTITTPLPVYNLYYNEKTEYKQEYNKQWPGNTPRVWHIEYASDETDLSHQPNQSNTPDDTVIIPQDAQ